MQKFVKGCKSGFLQISLHSRGEDLFFEINILRAISGNLFVTVTSITVENGILCFPEEGTRIRVSLRMPLMASERRLFNCNVQKLNHSLKKWCFSG